jgi:hypothetical protein
MTTPRHSRPRPGIHTFFDLPEHRPLTIQVACQIILVSLTSYGELNAHLAAAGSEKQIQ